MFSRALSVRSLLSRSASSAAVRPLAPMAAALPSRFNAGFHSTTPARQNTAAGVAKADDGIIAKYGSLPFFGGIASILIGKELYMLDAEFLLALEVGAFATAAYIMIGDTHQKWCDEKDAKAKKQFEESHDFTLECIHQYKLKQSALMNKPIVMEQYLNEYKAATEAYAAYQTVLPKHEAYQKMMSTLNDIKTKEDQATAAAWQNTVNQAMANVTGKLMGADAKLKAELIDFAIARMNMSEEEVKAVDDDKDPVKRLFLDEFK